MNYRIELETRAVQEFHKLPKEAQVRLGAVIDSLGIEPRPVGAKKLTNHEGYRLRKGDYRILYVVHDKASLVRIYRIGHRREIYRNLR